VSSPGNCGVCGKPLLEKPKEYRCDNCQSGGPISVCATCFEAWKTNKGLCTKEGCKDYNAKVLAEREAAKRAKAKPPTATAPDLSSKLGSGGSSSSSSSLSTATAPSPDQELATLATQFNDTPTYVAACAMAHDKLSAPKATGVLIAALKASAHVARVPGVSRKQMFLIFTYAFARGSTVVLGGSRVRSYFSGAPCYTADSDIDLGYSGLDKGQIGGVLAKFQKPDGTNPDGYLKLESFLIAPNRPLPGGGGTMASPEEFFHTRALRPSTDPKHTTERITSPSGSITCHPDGRIVESPNTIVMRDLVGDTSSSSEDKSGGDKKDAPPSGDDKKPPPPTGKGEAL
jgi:hypothetical protein